MKLIKNVTEEYKNEFISEFMKYFPNYYTENELKSIVDENVSNVIIVDKFDDDEEEELELKNVITTGRYNYGTKTISLIDLEPFGRKNKFNSIVFHEFIHALRAKTNKEFYEMIINNPYIPFMDEANVLEPFKIIDEAFTSAIENIYAVKKANPDATLVDDKYLQYIPQKNNGSYYFFSMLAQQYSMLGEYFKNTEDLYGDFIKGKNILPKLYNIFTNFIKIENDKLPENEKLSDFEVEMTAARALYYQLQYLELFFTENDLLGLYQIIKQYTENNMNMSSVFAENDKRKKDIHSKFIKFNEHLFTAEERLFKAIFGNNETPLDTLENNIAEQACILSEENPYALIKAKKERK